MTDETKNPVGRPTDYREAHCETVLELGKLGKSVTQMAVGLGVVKQTLYDWEKKYPLFLDSMTRARQLSQDWWETKGQDSLDAMTFQAAVYNKQMMNRFPEDHRDVSTVRSQQLDKDGKEADPFFKTILDEVKKLEQEN